VTRGRKAVRAPRVIVPGAADDPLVVVRSGFWDFQAVGIFCAGEAAVVDPGITPEDLELLRAELARNGVTRITHVLVTHSHHDHIRGWDKFEGACVVMPRVAAEKSAEAQGRILAAKSRIDAHLGIEDPGFTYPHPDVVFDESVSLEVGGLEVEMHTLTGHSNCTSVVTIPAANTLVSADYLVFPGLPYCRWEARSFEASLDRLTGFVLDEGSQRGVAAHREVYVGEASILAAIDEDREYFHALRQQVEELHTEGIDGEEWALRAARAMQARRGRALGGRERQDVDNARRVIAEQV